LQNVTNLKTFSGLIEKNTQVFANVK
jgi:hypothetical protein